MGSVRHVRRRAEHPSRTGRPKHQKAGRGRDLRREGPPLGAIAYDTEAGTCQLPGQKLLKSVHLLTEPCFDPGNRAIPLIEVQRLRGNATCWTTCQPSLRPELGAIDVLPAQQQPGDLYVCPKGSPDQVTAAYQEFWDSVEVIWVLVTRLETREATFTVGLEGLLNPRDRLAPPLFQGLPSECSG